MSVKIIQILIGPDNSTYQGNILGLGSAGIAQSGIGIEHLTADAGSLAHDPTRR